MKLKLVEVILILLLAPNMALAKGRVLLTAFDPWGGAEVNQSLNAATAARAELERSGYQVDLCVLPVIYDTAADVARECYLNLPTAPVLVASLGQGTCSIAIETAAHNYDMQPRMPDNAGVIRAGQLNDRGGPPNVAFGSLVMDMYCSTTSQERSNIEISESPGGYVCNNTAYHLGRYFKGLAVPYVFIHVPGPGCRAENDRPEVVGKLIAKMIQAPSRFDQLTTQLPTKVKQADALLEVLAQLQPGPVKACGLEFMETLRSRLTSRERWFRNQFPRKKPFPAVSTTK